MIWQSEKEGTDRSLVTLPTTRAVQQTAPLDIAHQELAAGDNDAAIWFRQFCAVPHARQLFVDGRPVELGSRAFDLLLVLIQARGVLITKEEMMSRVWPSTTVDESNLRVQMAALRKALGQDRDVIKTIPGRGYIFAAEVERRPIVRPQARVAQQAEASPEQGERPTADPERPRAADDGRSQPTVAVIDDDPDVRESLHGLLRSAGLRAEVFSSIEELVSDENIRPDCLVLDVWLPGRSGLDFHAELVRKNPRLPVIFMSGHADVPMSVQAMKFGAVEFLTKPVRYQDLLNAIETALGLRAAANC